MLWSKEVGRKRSKERRKIEEEERADTETNEEIGARSKGSRDGEVMRREERENRRSAYEEGRREGGEGREEGGAGGCEEL